MSLAAPEDLTWQENWGERSYGWGDPWEPKVKLSVFLPADGDYKLQATDSLGQAQLVVKLDSLRRGWQLLSFVPKSKDDSDDDSGDNADDSSGDNEDHLPVGAYTLTLSSEAEPTVQVKVDWAIVEEE